MLATKLENTLKRIKKAEANVSDHTYFFNQSDELRNYILTQETSIKRSANSWRIIMEFNERTKVPVLEYLNKYSDSETIFKAIGQINTDLLDLDVIEHLMKNNKEIREMYNSTDSSGETAFRKTVFFYMKNFSKGIETTKENLVQFLLHSNTYSKINYWLFIANCIQRNYNLKSYPSLKLAENNYGNDTQVKRFNELLELDIHNELNEEGLLTAYSLLNDVPFFSDTKVSVLLRELLNIIGFKKLFVLLRQYETKNLKPSKFEVGKLILKANYQQLDVEEDIFVTIYGEKNAALFVQGIDKFQRNFLESVIQEKKKGFISRLSSSLSSMKDLDPYVFEKIKDVVNLNTLSSDEIAELNGKSYGYGSVYESALKYFEGKEITLTLNELKTLSQKSSSVFYELYEKCINLGMKIDERLKLIRELPFFRYEFKEDKMIVNKLSTFPIIKDLGSKLAELFSKTNFKKLVKNYGLKCKDDVASLFSIIFWEQVKPFAKEVKSLEDVAIIVKFGLESGVSLKAIKEIAYLEDSEYIDFHSNINYSDEFKKTHLEGINKFHEEGLTSVFNKMYADLDSRQQENFKRITKAVIAGKLKEVKYVKDDFEKEIGLDISDEVKEMWKEDNVLKSGDLLVKDADDFDTTVRLGQYPVTTCQHWKSGSYRKALLSNFDTNKKILKAYYKGAYVARAVVRLTKVADSPPVKLAKKKETFGFKDVENVNTEVAHVNTTDVPEVKERLALFLELTYTSLDDDNARKAKTLFINLLKKKAKEMGAELIISSSYVGLDIDCEEKSLFVYISRSKNGSQYLDSMGGSVKEKDEKTYHKSTVKALKL